jgi:hypothetical protein
MLIVDTGRCTCTAIPCVVFVSDLRHFLDLPEDVPVPARRMAEHLTLIVRAATAGEGGQPWVSALPCRRRPGRQPCPGHFALYRADVPPSIEWRCTACGDDGVIRGWEGAVFDLRPRRPELVSMPSIRMVVSAEVVATLRDLRLVDTAGERLIFRARAADDDDSAVLLRRPTTRRTVAARSGSTKPSRRSRTSSISRESPPRVRGRGCHEAGDRATLAVPQRAWIGGTSRRRTPHADTGRPPLALGVQAGTGRARRVYLERVRRSPG